ncbi:MAG: hypothetical protein R6V05_07775 [Candidatus Brocadiia bacterium]
MMRRHTPTAVAALLLAALLLCAGPGTRAAGALSLRRREGRLVVSGARLRAVIEPGNGGRVTSFTCDGVELTGLDAGGHGGLVEEVHSSDVHFTVAGARAEAGQAEVRLKARAGALGIEKHYVFRRDRPWFVVNLRFVNYGRFPLAGSRAPALRNLVLPAGEEATGRELYCLNRGRGAEVRPAHSLVSALHEDPGARMLRWFAVAEPAARRAVGFALRHGGCRALPPLRAGRGGLIIGWSYPAIPPEHSMDTAVLVAPLDGFPAVSEMNEQFAADSVPLAANEGGRLRVRFSFVPLQRSLTDVSVITRVYDASGKEGEPCDPMLFEDVPPLQMAGGETEGVRPEAGPGWLLHEVYSQGELRGRFAVSADGAPASPPPSTPLPRPEPVSLGGREPDVPGSALLAGPAGRRGSFVVWQFDGAPARQELERIEMMLTAEQKRTAFLGVRTVHAVRGLRLTLAGAGPDQEGRAMPPGAVQLWRVVQPEEGPAWLTPLSSVDLDADQVAWYAVTVDSSALEPGRYSAQIVLSAGQQVRGIPLVVRALAVPGPPQGEFSLWYLGARGGETLSRSDLAKLRDHGVAGVTLQRGHRDRLHAEVQELGYHLLALRADGATVAPDEPAGGRSMLPCRRPAWLIEPTAAAALVGDVARSLGYTPARLTERLEPAPAAGAPCHLLVRNGCEPGRAPALVADGELTGDEPVWLYLDLEEADWRAAAGLVHGALWAAAWQGMAGVAVRCEAPARAMDRQLVLWHILRDARDEVSLWRRVRDQVRRARRTEAGTPTLPADALLALERFDRAVGPQAGCILRLREEQVPFRRLYRVAPPSGVDVPTLGQFQVAWQAVLGAAVHLAASPVPPVVPDRFWQDVPLLTEGQVQWQIVALEGEEPWQVGLRLQERLRRRTGRVVPLQRTFPPLDVPNAPALVWVVGPAEALSEAPEPWQRAVRQADGGLLSVTELPSGTVVVLLGDRRLMDAALRPLRATRWLLRTSRHVR